MATGNGNGNTSDIKDRLVNIKLEDIVEVSVLSLFFVQKLGKASMGDVDTKLRDIGGEVNEHLLDQALEGLRARGLLSYASGKNKTGDFTKMYKTTKVKWAAPPEVAHISDLLPALVATDEAKEIISVLNASEESGKDGTKKAKSKLGYTDYFEMSVTFVTKNPMLGSQPDSQYLKKIVEKSPFKYPTYEKGQNILRFWRDEVTGAVVIPSDVVGGWLRTGIRQGFGLSDSAANYIAVDDVHIMPKHLDQVSLPIIDQSTRKGLGIGVYELLPKGTEFTIHFRVPKKGVAEPMQFIAWLIQYAPKPTRGLSPARGKRFGKLEVIDYHLFGESAKVANALAAVENDIQDPRAKKLHAEMLAKAKQFDMSFKPGKGGDLADDDVAAEAADPQVD